MNNNKRCFVFIILVLISHITSAEKDHPRESNYSSINTIFSKISLAIEDERNTDHVKIIACGITSDVLSAECYFINNCLANAVHDELTIKTNNKTETVRVTYKCHDRFLLSVLTFMQWKREENQVEEEGIQLGMRYHKNIEILCCNSSQKMCIGKTLQNAIILNQMKTDYDKEKQTLTDYYSQKKI